MENFATARQMDPLLAGSWYSIPDEAFYKDKVEYRANSFLTGSLYISFSLSPSSFCILNLY